MTEKPFMDRLEDILDEKGLRTFDDSQQLEYRFGAFNATEGPFRCFVYEDDVVHMSNYMEIRGDHTYWIALDYPGVKAVMDTVANVADKCWRVLGKQHAATFILALEEGIAPEEKEKLFNAFDDFKEKQRAGTYYFLKIWDTDELKNLEEELLKEKGKV